MPRTGMTSVNKWSPSNPSPLKYVALIAITELCSSFSSDFKTNFENRVLFDAEEEEADAEDAEDEDAEVESEDDGR